MGGLASAARLSALGHDVTVIEKEASVGGKARRVTVDGELIEAGPTVFTMRDVYDGIFRGCGERLEDHVTVRRAEVLARHAWGSDHPGGAGRLDLFADPLRSEAAIGDFAGREAALGYRRFRAATRRMHDILDEPMMRGDNVSSPLPLLWRIGLHRLDAFAAMRPHTNMWKALAEFFPDPRLRQLFGRYATYCGSSPFAAPATLMLIAHVEARGVWLIEGGIHSLARALHTVCAARGVTFRFGTAVSEIEVANGRASGVRLVDGSRIGADAVICNADPNALATGQLGEGAMRAVRALPAQKRSLSAMVWFAHAQTDGFDMTHHNVVFSPDYGREFAEIADGRIPSDPSVYVCAQDRSARQERGPEITGRERLQIIVNAPANGDTHTYSSEEIEQCTRAMTRRLARCGLTLERDMPSQVASPTDWNRLYPATGGALYGRASHGSAASFLRQGQRTRLPGLYCAGGATHPSAGVPMAALSGLLAAKTASADLTSMRRSIRAGIPGGISMRSAKTGSMG
jgi:1-hydroxycarotenoid 3,4-desaturase